MSKIDDAIDFYNEVCEANYDKMADQSIRPAPLPRHTEETIRATEDALGFMFPPTFRQFIIKSRYYGFIQKDLNHPHSLVYTNRWIHEDNEWYLPKFLILFMGGHDGDCNCFDSRFRDENGECPVVYWDAENMREQDIEGLKPTHTSFLEFLEFITAYKLNRL
jgi:hypothetical protein